LNDYKSIAEVLEYKIGKFLCWPEYNPEEAARRIEQLKLIGVEAIAEGGPHAILGTSILGKGHAGVVLRALYLEEEVALKARRTDTDRISMKREASLLSHANKWNVGPRLLGVSDDFIVMELLVGPYFGDWVVENLDNHEAVLNNIRAILGIAWKLDQSGLDHGELTHIRRHYVVTLEGPRVIDFESASLDRAPSNLTSTIQSLFMNYRFSQLLSKMYPMPNHHELLGALRIYKLDPSERNYHSVLEACNL
jgi:putative serine/threonine protein kinase